MELTDLQAEVSRFAHERGWEQFHDPKNLTMALASEVGELLAVLRWVPSESADETAKGEAVRARLADEIGDVGILLLLLCRRTGIDLGTAVRDKLRRNESRYPVESSRGRAERVAPEDASHGEQAQT